MAKLKWWADFLDKLFPVTEKVGPSSIIIDIPTEVYYLELELYTAASLIANAIARSEIKVYNNGVAVKDNDYFMLNVSPNRNETSALFWHKVINKMVRSREGEALVVEFGGRLYCADSFTRVKEDPFTGDIYGCVVVDGKQIPRTFTQGTSYLMRIDNSNVRKLLADAYDGLGEALAAAASQFKSSAATRYKLHIDGYKAGDADFNNEFKGFVQEQLKTYLQAETAVYPEFDGYTLTRDDPKQLTSSNDYLQLKKEVRTSVMAAMHIPESMLTGQITSVKDVLTSFLTFAVAPYADVIEEALNKRAGMANYMKGSYYKVDMSKIKHRDILDCAQYAMAILSTGAINIDELREEFGKEALNTDWSKKHFMTKNLEEITRLLKSLEEGEQTDGENVLPADS